MNQPIMILAFSFLDIANLPEDLNDTVNSSSPFLSAWVIWVIIALFFFILEIFTTGFAVACFSVGAIAAAIAAGLGLGLAWQLILFSLLTFLAFVTVRPLVLKHFYQSEEAQRKSNVDALIGRSARVTEEINNSERKGRVAIDGDDWRAVSACNRIISAGENVTVKKVDSIILTVD